MSTALGSFPVRAAAPEVAAFRAATGLAEGDVSSSILPLTFPIRWLVTSEVRARLLAMVPEPELVLVHESQVFAYQHALRADEAYTLTLTGRREAAPDRLFVDGTIVDEDGVTRATVETILRLFSTTAVAA